MVASTTNTLIARRDPRESTSRYPSAWSRQGVSAIGRTGVAFPPGDGRSHCGGLHEFPPAASARALSRRPSTLSGHHHPNFGLGHWSSTRVIHSPPVTWYHNDITTR